MYETRFSQNKIILSLDLEWSEDGMRYEMRWKEGSRSRCIWLGTAKRKWIEWNKRPKLNFIIMTGISWVCVGCWFFFVTLLMFSFWHCCSIQMASCLAVANQNANLKLNMFPCSSAESIYMYCFPIAAVNLKQIFLYRSFLFIWIHSLTHFYIFGTKDVTEQSPLWN